MGSPKFTNILKKHLGSKSNKYSAPCIYVPFQFLYQFMKNHRFIRHPPHFIHIFFHIHDLKWCIHLSRSLFLYLKCTHFTPEQSLLQQVTLVRQTFACPCQINVIIHINAYLLLLIALDISLRCNLIFFSQFRVDAKT